MKKMLEDSRFKKEIRIGSMTVLSPYHFAKVMSAFMEQYPDIDLILDEQTADQVLAHLEEFDFAILRSLLITDTSKYNFITLYDDYLCAVVYDSHPLAGRKSIRLEELKDEEFVFPQKGSGGYEAFYDSCIKAGFTPNILYEFPQANTIMSFVEEKIGITINFTKVCQESAGSGVRMIPLEDAPPFSDLSDLSEECDSYRSSETFYTVYPDSGRKNPLNACDTVSSGCGVRVEQKRGGFQS